MMETVDFGPGLGVYKGDFIGSKPNYGAVVLMKRPNGTGEITVAETASVGYARDDP